MTEKNVKSRIVHKHDTETNWDKAINFIPKLGELIVYDPDENYSIPRQKIGDGETVVKDLPFVNKQVFYQEAEPIGVPGDLWLSSSVVKEGSTTVIENVQPDECLVDFFNVEGNSIPLDSVNELEGSFTCPVCGKFYTFKLADKLQVSSSAEYSLIHCEQEYYGGDFNFWCYAEDVIDGEVVNGDARIITQLNEVIATPAVYKTVLKYKSFNGEWITIDDNNVGIDVTIEGEGASAFGIESIARGDATHAEGYQSLAGSYSFKFNLDHEYTEADYDTTDGTGWYYLTDVSGLKDLINSKEIKTTVNPETFDLKCFNDIFPIPYGAGYYLLTISLNEYQQNVLNKTKYTWEHQCSECGKVYRFEFTLPEYDWPSGAEEIGIFPTWWNDNDDFVHFRIGVECYAVEDFGPDVIPEIYTIDNVIEYPEYTLVLKNNYDFWGRLLAVDEENKAIQVSNYKIPVEGTGTEVKETSYFIIPTHPELGTEFVIGAGAHAEGYQTVAFALGAHAEGYASIASGKYSHAEGRQTKAGYAAHAEGRETLAKGENTHAEGVWTEALGGYSHAEGYKTKSIGTRSHAEGSETEASGNISHAEGNKTKSIGHYSHAEGDGTKADSNAAHAEGFNTVASGGNSHAEGNATEATGESAHAEGGYSEAKAKRSHAEGSTVAGSEFQHTQGKYNIIDTEGKYAHIVGNGKGSTQRSNAHTVDWEGNAWYAGDVTAKNGKLISTEEVGYERDIHFIPYGKDQNVLFQFNTSAKTLTVKAIRFMLPKMMDISTDTVLSYDGITTNPNFLVFDHEYTDKTKCLKIVKRDELKSLKTRYSVILTFSLQNLANTANVSYKGPYSVDGVIYNKNYTDSSINTLINTATSKFEKDLASKYVEKTGDVSNTVITYDLVNKPIKANLLVPGLYETGTNILKLSQKELIDQGYFFIFDESAEFHTSSKASSLTGDLVLKHYGGPITTLDCLTNINSITFTGNLPYSEYFGFGRATYPESQNLQYLYFPYNSYEEIFANVVDSQNNTIKYIFNDRIVDRNGQSITVTTPYTNSLTSVFSELYNRNFDIQVKLNSANWIYLSSKYYYQSIPINGILKTDTPIVDIVLGKDRNANKNSLTAWENITRIETDNGSILVYADWVKPTTDITIQLKVVR